MIARTVQQADFGSAVGGMAEDGPKGRRWMGRRGKNADYGLWQHGMYIYPLLLYDVVRIYKYVVDLERDLVVCQPTL